MIAAVMSPTLSPHMIASNISGFPFYGFTRLASLASFACVGVFARMPAK
jgi:hypothetical protein